MEPLTRRTFLGTVAGLSVTALFPAATEKPKTFADYARSALHDWKPAEAGPFELVLQTTKGELRYPLAMPQPAKAGHMAFPRFELYAQSPMTIHSGEIVCPQFSCPVDFGHPGGASLATGDRFDVTGEIGFD